MQQFRANLTRLKSLVEQRLPDGSDIYGYPGVSKPALLTAIEAAYSLSQAIKPDDETRFEVISLKRTGSTLYQTLKEFLEADDEDTAKRSRFNDFLNSLSALVEKTKITYYIVSTHGIRNDEELAHIRGTIAELTEQAGELKEEKAEAESQLASISAAIDGIQSHHKAAAQMSSEIKQWHGTAGKLYPEIEQTHEAIAGWDEEIQERGEQYQSQSKQIAELATAAAQSRDKLSADAAAGAKHVEELAKTAEEHRKLLEEIRQTLAGANRVGMASSFEARKKDLGWQQLVWQVVFVAAVGLITLAVWKFVLPTIQTIAAGGQRWTDLLVELGIVFPLVWVGWFAAKQYGYTSKIREDYAFKSAAAMAYEGHKKAAREVDPELERILLEFSLYNMAQNPIRLYGTGDIHGTPLHEALDQLLKKFPKLRKVKGRIPTLGELEVSGEKEEPEQDE
jgi:predicted  nucleic acid-binding Zn-ribbon protein